jgi:hypothetical protein
MHSEALERGTLMLDSAAAMRPVDRPDPVDVTVTLAAARRALERDLKTLLAQFNRSGNSSLSVVPAQAGTHNHRPRDTAAMAIMGPRLRGTPPRSAAGTPRGDDEDRSF